MKLGAMVQEQFDDLVESVVSDNPDLMADITPGAMRVIRDALAALHPDVQEAASSYEDFMGPLD